MDDELVALVGLVLAWISREIIPIYQKHRAKKLAAKEDIERLERKIDRILERDDMK
jgi:hypothetical protein